MGILQAIILEWVAMPSSSGSSQSRDWTQVSCTAGDSLPSEPPRILYPRILQWVAYPFSRGSFPPRNQTGVSLALQADSLPAELPEKPQLFLNPGFQKSGIWFIGVYLWEFYIYLWSKRTNTLVLCLWRNNLLHSEESGRGVALDASVMPSDCRVRGSHELSLAGLLSR